MKLGQAADSVWFNVATRYGSVEVALDPSPDDFKKMYRDLTKGYARYQRKHDGALPPGVDEEVSRKCLAHAVMRGWRNGVPEDESGEPMEFTPENVLRVFEDPVIGGPFQKGVMDAATELWDATAQELEETAKN